MTATATVRAKITSLVEALLVRRGGATPVAPDQNLADAGLTSLDLVNLMLAIEDTFEVEIPQERMSPASFRTIDAIERMLSSLALAA
ncbi:MAG TPA: phosphopantetheine-binding protein [Caulobacteraceae bacterium]|nr:phosphopantetheine-binding protein [Caulobacteraceae bacterium]